MLQRNTIDLVIDIWIVISRICGNGNGETPNQGSISSEEPFLRHYRYVSFCSLTQNRKETLISLCFIIMVFFRSRELYLRESPKHYCFPSEYYHSRSWDGLRVVATSYSQHKQCHLCCTYSQESSSKRNVWLKPSHMNRR